MARANGDAWQGPRKSMRTLARGATWRVGAGIWRAHRLVIWGGNANALHHPLFYSRHFPLFLRCGTMFPRGFFCTGHVAAPWTSDAIALDKGASIAWTRVQEIIIKARALKET